MLRRKCWQNDMWENTRMWHKHKSKKTVPHTIPIPISLAFQLF